MTLLAVTVVIGLSACGASRHVPSPLPAPAPANSPSPTTLRGLPGAAEVQACRQAVAAIQEGADRFALQFGRPASSIAALVTAGFVRDLPASDSGYRIDYDPTTGEVTARGACTG